MGSQRRFNLPAPGQTAAGAISDQHGRVYDVTAQGDARWFQLLVCERHRRIGHVDLCWHAQAALRILDLYVDRPYRNKGIGSALLVLIRNVVYTHALPAIEGSVSRRDLRDTPFLLAWWAQRGFAVELRAADGKIAALVWTTMSPVREQH